jgi:23S rRNA pseudouridine955/2504/2580 synthase
MALHAYSLTFADMKGNIQKIEAPYPKDLQALVKQLETNS